MNILITGSSGFIGKKLVNFLINYNNSIKNIYVLVRSENFINKNNNKNIKFISILNLKIKKIDIDAVIHLASKAHIKNFTSDDAKSSLFLTKELLSFCILNNITKFIYFSSIKVYGEYNTDNNIFTETNVANPLCNYSMSKFANESEIIKFFHERKVNYYILRIPLVIGRGAKGNLNSLMQIITNNIPLPLNGIDNHRSVISLTNLMHSVNNILMKNNIESGIFNICDNNPISTSNLVNLIKIFLNKKTKIFYINKKIIKFFLVIFGRSDDYSKLFLSQIMNNNKSINKKIYKNFISTQDEIKNMVFEFKKLNE